MGYGNSMPFNDGIPRHKCFSLTDFHDYDFCQFRFFVKHHLEKKYELEEPNYNMALGILLDNAIKKFHESKAYGCEPSYLKNLVKAAENFIRSKVTFQKAPSFYSLIIPLLDQEMLDKAAQVFENYYISLDKKIKRSLGPVGFCEFIVKTRSGDCKLWGGPDAYELGDDGMAEVVDYKYREGDSDNFDMDLMPKIYTLLASKYLLSKGYEKARFIVRLWQKPGNDSLYEEFDLKTLVAFEGLFIQRIEQILGTTNLKFCEQPFCKACKSDKRQQYINELVKNNFISLDTEIVIDSTSLSAADFAAKA